MTITTTRAMSERQLQDGLVAAARRLNYLVYFTWKSIHSPAGFPDLVICGHGKMIFIECKSAKGKPSEPQQEWLRTLREAGQEAFVVTPAEYDLVLADLQEWAS